MSLRDLVTGRLLTAETSREGDRVTNLELFFDLVFVFAFTQVTALMSRGYELDHGALGVVQGLGVLATIWWAWTSYAWLANQAHADRGIIRISIIVATVLMFLVSLAIPDSFEHGPGQFFAPLAFVVGIALVSAVHGVVYTIAAGEDRGLRRQIVRSLVAVNLPVVPLLLVGAFLGGAWQAWLWLAAPMLEFVVIYLTSHGGDWRINSLAHFAERHGLVVILALGESVVAIGTGILRGRGAEGEAIPLGPTVLVGATLSIVIALVLWWSYFTRLSARTEHAIGTAQGVERVNAATDAFTYLHLPLIAGVIIAALGIETAMHAVAGGEPLGLFGATALGGGIALYLASTALVWLRVSGQWSLIRIVAAVLSLLAVPVIAVLPSLAGLGTLATLLVAATAVEEAFGPRVRLRRGVAPRRADAAAS